MQQRLFEITWLLTEHGSLTAAELAERFGVSRRTIYRDIDALCMAGIPVYTEKGRGGGIRMLPDFVLDKTMFTEEERRQLMVGVDSLAGIEMPGTREISDKLAALFGRREDAWLEVDFMPWAGGEDAREMFNLLRDSILQHRVIAFDYTGVGGTATARTAEPCKLLFRGQGWYLQAWCRTRQDFRIFKTSRMHGVRMLEESFAPKQPPPLRGEMPQTKPPRPVRLWVAASSAYRVYDEFPAESITKQADGSFLISCEMGEDDWLAGYLLGYGADLTVLAPEDLRQTMAAIFEKGLENYTKK